MMRLPKKTFADYGDIPRCPWCGEPADDLAVPLWQLSDFLQRGFGHFVEVSEDGATDADVVVGCSHCEKPSALALKAEGMLLLPVRTDADRRLLAGGEA